MERVLLGIGLPAVPLTLAVGFRAVVRRSPLVPGSRMHAEPDASAGALDAVGAEVAQCRACPRLVEWREDVARTERAAYADEQYWGRGVPAFGDPAARVVVVGLAPAAHGANRTGRMFTGLAGLPAMPEGGEDPATVSDGRSPARGRRESTRTGPEV
jgi:hypothetical protein